MSISAVFGEKMRSSREYYYHVKCRECGWEGYTLLRGYHGGGYLYLECERCGARNLYLNPPSRKDVIFIGGTAIHDFAHAIGMAVRGGWDRISAQPMSRKIVLGGGITIALVFLVCLMMFREYTLHFLIAGAGTIASALALALRRGE